MYSMEELKSAVREARAGRPPEGFALEGEILTVPGGGRYFVVGEERLRLQHIPQPKEAARDMLGSCRKCGKQFLKSKFNPYFDLCPECRRPGKRYAPGARSFVCKECGQTFEVSKFQPYLNPERCPKCTAKAHRREYLKRRKEAQGDQE